MRVEPETLQEILYCRSAVRQDVAAGENIWEAEVTGIQPLSEGFGIV